MTPLAPLIAAALLAPSQAETPFAWKLQKGDVFYAKAVSVMKQTVEAAGQKQEQEQEQTVYHKYAIKSADKDGIVLEQTILRADVTGNLPGAGEAAKKMKGIVLTFTLNAKMEVTKVGGYDKFLDSLAGDDPAARKLLASVLNEDTVKQGVTELFGLAPAKAVKVGDSWKKTTKMSMGPLGSFKADADYKYASGNATTDKASWKANATYSAPKDGGDGPFTISKGELKSDKFEGEFSFDKKTGRVASSVTRAHFAGKLTISVMGQEIEMEMDQNLTITTTVTDKNPVDD